jgi:hypothetical protein
MLAVVLGLALAAFIVFAIAAHARRSRATPPREGPSEEELRDQRRASDIAKFLADPRLLK